MDLPNANSKRGLSRACDESQDVFARSLSLFGMTFVVSALISASASGLMS